jgi:aldose 1-epimerase
MAVHEGVVDGHATITLASSELEATFLPALGMLCGSLLHRGEQLLELPGGLSAYEKGGTVGIPLLHPWANRLAGFEYRADGRHVRLDPDSPLLGLDPNGLPIHGLVIASPHWSVAEAGDEAGSARLRAELDFGAHEDLLAAFPYPHVVALDARVTGSELALTTTITPTGDLPVPVSFGFHPYFRLPRAPREEWEVELPVQRRLELDERMIPTGQTEAVSYPRASLGERVFDDGYEGVEEGAVFVLAGGGRELRVSFDRGYPYAQVYAPAGSRFICFEPMTAPTNALISGDGLRAVDEPFSATFSVQA